MPQSLPIYKIVRWAERYEPSIVHAHPSALLSSVAFPIAGVVKDLSFTEGYQKLVRGRKGPSNLGAWICLVVLGSRLFPRGILISPAGVGLNALALSRETRLPSKLYLELIPLLLEIQWLEIVSQNDVAQIIETAREARR